MTIIKENVVKLNIIFCNNNKLNKNQLGIDMT